MLNSGYTATEDDIEKGTLTPDQEGAFFTRIRDDYFSIAMRKNRDIALNSLQTVTACPTRHNFEAFIDVLVGLLDSVTYEDWPESKCSEKLFFAGFFMARNDLIASKGIDDNMITQFFDRSIFSVQSIQHRDN